MKRKTSQARVTTQQRRSANSKQVAAGSVISFVEGDRLASYVVKGACEGGGTENVRDAAWIAEDALGMLIADGGKSSRSLLALVDLDGGATRDEFAERVDWLAVGEHV